MREGAGLTINLGIIQKLISDLLTASCDVGLLLTAVKQRFGKVQFEGANDPNMLGRGGARRFVVMLLESSYAIF